MKLLEWAREARKQISGLDADLILVHTLGFSSRIELIIHANDEYDFEQADSLLEKRATGIPLAYLLGYREFYGRKFSVNQNVLIPRPETEQIIDSALKIVRDEKYTRVSVVDVGTGSGCIPITLKLELSKIGVKSDVLGVDVSEPALDLARVNAANHLAEVQFCYSDLLKAVKKLPDIITANLPYVDVKWDWTSEELKFEPALALFAADNGLYLIKKLIDQIIKKLDNKKRRFLLLEADTSQHDAIIEYAEKRGMKNISRDGFIIGFSY